MNNKKVNFIDVGGVGDYLREEWLEPLGLSHSALGAAIGVPANRITNIINGKTGISVDTDLRLCRYFGMSDGFFIRMQNSLDSLKARQYLDDVLNQIKPYEYPDNRDRMQA